jgi:PTH1 family peptidyl-tRNA hydrolase
MFNLQFWRSNKKHGDITIHGKRIKMIVGLGNPEEKYRNTYHNLGFMFLDFLLELFLDNETENRNLWKNTKYFKFTKTNNTIFIKPETFMNNSGLVVKNALRYFKLKPENILVIHDDSDITIGDHKISIGGGSAGHKGIESIIKTLKTKDFMRLRIGVGNSNKKAGDFILSQIKKRQHEKLEAAFLKIQACYFKGYIK